MENPKWFTVSHQFHCNHTTRVKKGKSHFFHYLFRYLSVCLRMSDNYDWEEWNESATTFRQHVLAGCVAGVSEHIVFFPIDTVRVCAMFAVDHFVDQSPSS